ncbi:MAG: peptidoglycan DD-metalloendopeptidase family protein [Cellvibrio sp.]|jgi:Membrane proteins related to metalloendopeptidases
MKIIILNKHHGQSRSISLAGWTRALLSVCLLGMPGVLCAIGYNWLEQDKSDFFSTHSRQALEEELIAQKEQLERTRQEAEAQLAALTMKIAEMQARLVRLDALGERLTTVAKLEEGEFDFSQPPAIGGPETAAAPQPQSTPELIRMVDQLSSQIENREQQLETLDALLAKRKIQEDVFVAGRPVLKGWMASRFGRRTDPFTGNVAFHAGIDFATREGSDVISVAAGVVTISARHADYGNMVEINHGNGYATRYAHNKTNLVKVGDVVKKGQIIALVGSTGRSTGPHVHFEVYKHGRPVDPATYIHRASR